MARKNSSIAPEEELYDVAKGASLPSRDLDDSPLDARMMGLEDEAESPFLRGQKRIPVRRGALPRKAASRIKIALILLLSTAFLAFVVLRLHDYASRSWRFRIDSSDNIQVSGNHNVGRSQIMELMASDIDRNIFFVPLDVRKRQLQQIAWVHSASVMRLLPNRLQIVIEERKPVAFVEVNSHIELIDSDGVIMELPPGQQENYSFPVLVNMSDAEPLSTRAVRMKNYLQLVHDLDSSGAHYSHDLSDIDLTDPDDVKATVTDPQGAVLVHLGAENFLERFKVYMAHVQEWRTQFKNLRSVDLRYEHQVIVNPDSAASEAQPAAAAVEHGSGTDRAPAARHTSPSKHKTKKHF
jgi:cell division protein FtsQ